MSSARERALKPEQKAEVWRETPSGRSTNVALQPSIAATLAAIIGSVVVQPSGSKEPASDPRLAVTSRVRRALLERQARTRSTACRRSRPGRMPHRFSESLELRVLSLGVARCRRLVDPCNPGLVGLESGSLHAVCPSFDVLIPTTRRGSVGV